MHWWLSKPTASQAARLGDGSLEDTVRRSLLLARLQDLVALGRKHFLGSLSPIGRGKTSAFRRQL